MCLRKSITENQTLIVHFYSRWGKWKSKTTAEWKSTAGGYWSSTITNRHRHLPGGCRCRAESSQATESSLSKSNVESGDSQHWIRMEIRHTGYGGSQNRYGILGICSRNPFCILRRAARWPTEFTHLSYNTISLPLGRQYQCRLGAYHQWKKLCGRGR